MDYVILLWHSLSLPYNYFVTITGVGGAAGYTAAIIVIGLNFRHKRNLAMGFSISGKKKLPTLYRQGKNI